MVFSTSLLNAHPTMAAAMSVVATAMSKKQRMAILKKERRKRKRQALAQTKLCDGESQTPGDDEDDVSEPEHAQVHARQRLHEEWLERERLAQEGFKLKSEREEAARKKQEEEERRIKEEWEAQQRKEEEEKEHKQQERRNREEAVQKMLDQAESQLNNVGPWMNPEAPGRQNSDNYGTERDVQNCPFFLKTGACRFGDRCSRRHVYPTSSTTLMVRGMFVTFGMEQCHRDDYDTDASLEHSEEELHEHFLEFYHDVLPEFQSLGKVVQFKVSCNFEPHLRGNVYIQFATEEQCMDTYLKFNGRWYAGRQLECELCPVTRWKNAICGLFNKMKCPKGKHCNFLHVFRNPGNEFWEADRDLRLSPDRSGEGVHRGGWHSERRGERSWRHRHGSRSPPRSERSNSRRGSERRRSHSRERSYIHNRGESFQSESRSSRWRPASSRRERHRSREKDRGRSRSRSGSGDRERGRRRDRERDCRRSRERSRSVGCNQTGERRRSRSGSKGTEERRGRERNDEPSPRKHEDEERRDGASDNGSHMPRQHKHSKKSKKSKKKKKLKKKKKSRLAETTTSSGESENPDTEMEASPLISTDDVQVANLLS